MTHKKINGYSISLKEVLGRGSYGTTQVYKGEQDGTLKPCAVKVLEKKTIDAEEYLKRAVYEQISILQTVKSENIVAVYDVMESASNYYIIQELCTGDLQSYMETRMKKNDFIGEAEAIFILRQICNGFMTLVKWGIVHRDLKPANILMVGNKPKIADFGFAKSTSRSKREKILRSSVGTPLYMSLEQLRSQPHTSKCDVWSVGLIFYEMLHGRLPWLAQNEYQLVKNIETQPLKINPQFSELTKDFLTRVLQLKQQNRMSWDEVFLHPIFEKYFHQFALQNQQFEDKLKTVMRDLRMKINSHNIDINRLLQKLNFTNEKQLTYQKFTVFIRHINSNITTQEINFFFDKMDTNNDGGIDLKELSTEMAKHHIYFYKSKAENQEKFQTQSLMSQSTNEITDRHEEPHQKELSNLLAIKAKKCFIKLYRILSIKKLSLFKTFKAYATSKSGEMGFQEFANFIRKLDSQFTSDEISAIFEFIDVDQSKTIQFDQFNSFYCCVNGIPESLDRGSEHSLQGRYTK